MGNRKSSPLGAALKRLEEVTESAETWALNGHLSSLGADARSQFFATILTREPEIRDAISQICLEWIRGRQFVPSSYDQAYLFWMRFHYAYSLASWFRDHGFYCRQKGEAKIVTWLLIDFWERVALPIWKTDPGRLQPYRRD